MKTTSKVKSETRAIVTRYPTGLIGLDYEGFLFYHQTFKLSEMRAKLKSLGIRDDEMKWKWAYYDKQQKYRVREWKR